MRLGLDTEDKFLIKLNEINEQIQSTFLTEATKMTEKIVIFFIDTTFLKIAQIMIRLRLSTIL